VTPSKFYEIIPSILHHNEIPQIRNRALAPLCRLTRPPVFCQRMKEVAGAEKLKAYKTRLKERVLYALLDSGTE